MRPIDADALFKRIISAFAYLPADIQEILEMIEDAPTIEAEPVRRGKWLECEDGWGDTHYQCSECGKEWYLEAGTPKENGMNYCPNCGARMEVDNG